MATIIASDEPGDAGMDGVQERFRELRLRYYRNIDTGLVRSFLFPPKRGKWELTTLRHATPRGRAAILKAESQT